MGITTNYMKSYDNERLSTLRTEILDYLFDKNHQVTKPLVEDLAILVYNHEDTAVYKATITVTMQNKGV